MLPGPPGFAVSYSQQEPGGRGIFIVRFIISIRINFVNTPPKIGPAEKLEHYALFMQQA